MTSFRKRLIKQYMCIFISKYFSNFVENILHLTGSINKILKIYRKRNISSKKIKEKIKERKIMMLH